MMDISEADSEAKKRKKRANIAIAMVAMLEGDGWEVLFLREREKRTEWTVC